MTQHPNVLQDILEESNRLQSQGQKLTVIFDLDSTLFEVRHRTQKILHEFCEDLEHIQTYPDYIKALKKIRVEPGDWGIRTAVERNGFKVDDPDFVKKLVMFWRQRFFSDEYLHFDEPYDGAVEYVNQLLNLGVNIIYLTGRDEFRMGKGTREVLKKWGMPTEDEGATLILKPKAGMDDAAYKRDVVKGMAGSIWLFENEPENIYLILRDCPHVKIVFFDSTHSGKAPSPEHLPRIRHFNRKNKVGK